MNSALVKDITDDLNNILDDLTETIGVMSQDNVDIDEYCLKNIEFNYPQEDEYGLVYIIDTLSGFSDLSDKKKDIVNVLEIVVSFYKKEITRDQFLNRFKPED